jgi:hypothetical protein
MFDPGDEVVCIDDIIYKGSLNAGQRYTVLRYQPPSPGDYGAVTQGYVFLAGVSCTPGFWASKFRKAEDQEATPQNTPDFFAITRSLCG